MLDGLSGNTQNNIYTDNLYKYFLSIINGVFVFVLEKLIKSYLTCSFFSWKRNSLTRNTKAIADPTTVAVCDTPRCIVVILSMFASKKEMINAQPICIKPVSAEAAPATCG